MFEMEKHTLGLATEVLVMAIVISVILLFLGIGVLVLIHVWIVGRTLRNGVSERNPNTMVERESLGSRSMSQDDIEKLPCFDFAAKAKGSSPAGDCAVCLEGFKAGERCRLLPSCNHSFHAECVDLWLVRAPICPICRADLVDVGSICGGGEREGGGGGYGDERESVEQVHGDSRERGTREGVDSIERVMVEMREREEF